MNFNSPLVLSVRKSALWQQRRQSHIGSIHNWRLSELRRSNWIAVETIAVILLCSRKNEWTEDISAMLICTVVRVRGRHIEWTEIRNTGNTISIGFYYYSVLYVCVRLLLLAQAVFSFQNSFSPFFTSIKIWEEVTSSWGMLFLPN